MLLKVYANIARELDSYKHRGDPDFSWWINTRSRLFILDYNYSISLTRASLPPIWQFELTKHEPSNKIMSTPHLIASEENIKRKASNESSEDTARMRFKHCPQHWSNSDFLIAMSQQLITITIRSVSCSNRESMPAEKYQRRTVKRN